jgi:hypothetical protein
MKTNLSEPKSRKANKPLEVVKEGSISIPIYAHTNIIPQRDPLTGAILYETLPDGRRKALIKYRLAFIKDVGQVSLEAGNSPGMVFKHYRQLVHESAAKEWFCIMPPKSAATSLDAVTVTASSDANIASTRRETGEAWNAQRN